MANRQLTPDELNTANGLLDDIRERIRLIADGDPALAWAVRRKVAKELAYDERGKPATRKLLKAKLMVKQGAMCADCSQKLPARGAILYRPEAMLGYGEETTRLLCGSCHTAAQQRRGYA